MDDRSRRRRRWTPLRIAITLAVLLLPVTILFLVEDIGLYGSGSGHDRDGDGVRDTVDLCPDWPGPKEMQGCPVAAALPDDSDMDGVPNYADRCPDQGDEGYGLQANGCPKLPEQTVMPMPTPVVTSSPVARLTRVGTGSGNWG
jgi:hypothetical protein